MTAEDRFRHDVAQILRVARPTDSAERLALRLRRMTSSSGAWNKVKVFRRVKRMRRMLGLPEGLGAGRIAEAWRTMGPPPPRHTMARCPGCPECDARRATRLRRESAQAAERRRGKRPPPHHGASGFRNYGCRCPACCSAHAAMRRDALLRAAVEAAVVQPLSFADLLASARAGTTRADLRRTLSWLMRRARVEYRNGFYVHRPTAYSSLE